MSCPEVAIIRIGHVPEVTMYRIEYVPKWRARSDYVPKSPTHPKLVSGDSSGITNEPIFVNTSVAKVNFHFIKVSNVNILAIFFTESY